MIIICKFITRTKWSVVDSEARGRNAAVSSIYYVFSVVVSCVQNGFSFTENRYFYRFLLRQWNFFQGVGTALSQDPSPNGEGDTSSPHPTPSAPLAPQFSRLRRSTSAPTVSCFHCQYVFLVILGPGFRHVTHATLDTGHYSRLRLERSSAVWRNIDQYRAASYQSRFGRPHKSLSREFMQLYHAKTSTFILQPSKAVYR